MRIERISFCASNVNTKAAEIKNNDNKKDEVKSNISKYAAGTAIGIAALTGMVIAGRRGCLGEKIQKFLGGVEKGNRNPVKIKINDDSAEEILKEPVKIHTETSDIIKDGKKIGIVTKDIEGDKLVLTTTKTFDENGNVIAIDEKYAGVRKVEIKKTTVNHDNHLYTVWRYFEIPEKGSGKSINFKLYDNNDYSFDLICVYPDEIEAIKQKLIDNGVKFGKSLTNYPAK